MPRSNSSEIGKILAFAGSFGLAAMASSTATCSSSRRWHSSWSEFRTLLIAAFSAADLLPLGRPPLRPLILLLSPGMTRFMGCFLKQCNRYYWREPGCALLDLPH